MKRATGTKKKSFYVISALREDSLPLDRLKRHDTEAAAVEHAKSVIGKRRGEGQPDLAFHILKAIAIVAPQTAPVKISKLGLR